MSQVNYTLLRKAIHSGNVKELEKNAENIKFVPYAERDSDKTYLSKKLCKRANGVVEKVDITKNSREPAPKNLVEKLAWRENMRPKKKTMKKRELEEKRNERGVGGTLMNMIGLGS